MARYFCPKCGASLKTSECGIRKRRRIPLSYLVCLACDVKVQISGRACIIAGLLVWFFPSLCLCADLPIIAIILGTPLCAVGVMRLFRQWRARRRAGSRSQGDPRGVSR